MDDPNDPAAADDSESRRQGESLDSLESRWGRADKDKPTGVTSSISITGKSLYLIDERQDPGGRPAALVPAPLFPNNQNAIFFADAQVGTQTGVLVLEGPRIQVTAGTLGIIDIGSANANSVAPPNSPSPVVELTTATLERLQADGHLPGGLERHG